MDADGEKIVVNAKTQKFYGEILEAKGKVLEVDGEVLKVDGEIQGVEGKILEAYG